MKPSTDAILERLAGELRVYGYRITDNLEEFRSLALEPVLDDLEADGTSLFHWIEAVFGVEIPPGDVLRSPYWLGILGSDEEFTLGWLAERIQESLPDVDWSPREICGHTCAKAGAFLALRDIADGVRTLTEPLGPSSQVLDHLQGRRLARFWQQAQLLRGVALPPLVSWTERLATICGCACVVVGILSIVFILGAAFDLGPGYINFVMIWMLGWSLAIPLAIVSFLFLFLLGPRVRGLPNGVRTFRDLATYIASEPGVGRPRRAS